MSNLEASPRAETSKGRNNILRKEGMEILKGKGDIVYFLDW